LDRHLIHIGYPKAGSHFVQRWFACHPQLQFVHLRFAGFSDVRDLARQRASGPGTVRYLVTSAEEFAAPHPTAGTMDPERQGTTPEAQTAVRDTLVSLFRDPWILLLTRGFRSVLISGCSQYVRLGGHLDFFTGDAPSPAELDRARHSWNYNHLVRIYREAVGDRLIILPYELLRDDPQLFLRELERRLGLEPFDAPLDKIHPSFSPVELRWYPRISSLVRRLPLRGRLKKSVWERYVRSVRANRWRAPIKALQRLDPAQPITPDLVPRETLEYFRGRADELKSEPFYDRYAEDYLF
jgi:hypothetical protein